MRWLAIAALSLQVSACMGDCTYEGGEPDWSQPQEEEEWTPPPDYPPWFNDIEIRDFPPVGPDSSVTVYVEDDQRLWSLSYAFRETGSVDLRSLSEWGTSAAVELTGNMLGEGMGSLELLVEDSAGGGARTTVESLVVDLSPPRIELVSDILRPGPEAELEVWVGDAWVLGSLVLTFEGTAQLHEFPAVYPPTLGETWDYSLVRFHLGDPAEGTAEATLTATDAVGNRTVETIELTLDGTPPVVEILTPTPGEVVTGLFDVAITAEDAVSFPLEVALYGGGAHLATTTGPSALVTLDAAELPPGPLLLEAISEDEAGNSAETQLLIEVAH